MSHHPKHAVLVVTTPPDWKPERFHQLPPAIESATFYGRSLAIRQAMVIARAFNLAHMPCKGTFQRQWALAIHALDKSHHTHYAAHAGELFDLVSIDQDGNDKAVLCRLPFSEALAYRRGFNINSDLTKLHCAMRLVSVAMEGGAE